MCTDEAVAETGPSFGVSGETLVAVTDVRKGYSRRVAVHKLSLSLRAGDVIGLVGSNGSGKTTTLRMLAGILKPDEGHGQILGFDLVKEAGEIRERVGYMSQALSLYADLSVFENLRFRAQIYGLTCPRATAETAIVDFELTEFARTAAGRLSGGWARRLQLAAALIHSPRLVFLDEPTAGLDAVARHDVWRRIGSLAAAGAGVIVSTHDLAEAERCSYAALLSKGKIVAAGTPEHIAMSASADAFLLTGPGTRQLAQRIEAAQGVIACYPQGPSLRVVADPNSEESLRRVASILDVNLARVAMRLEDAVLAFSKLRSAQ
jgi:ABC-type multidrug transport system ATPase subunit